LRLFLRPVIDLLSAHGYQVEAACNEDEDAAWMRAQGYSVHYVPIPRHYRSPLRSLAAMRSLADLIRSGQYTIVHAHTPAAGLHTNFLAKRAGARFLFFSVWGLPYHPALFWPLRKILAWGHAAVVRRADLVFAAGSSVRQEILRYLPHLRDRVVVVDAGGVDWSAFWAPPAQREAVRQQIRAQLGIPPAAPLAVTVTRVVWSKGLRELLHAVALLRAEFPDLHLLIVGWGPAETGVRALAQQLQVADRVIMVGKQDHARVPHFLWASDIFVLPTYSEGFLPLSASEAMVAGLPVIVSDIPPCQEQVRPGYNGLLVPVYSIKPLVYAMATLLHNPSLGRELVQRAQEMLRDYTLEASAQQYLQAYNQFLASPSASSA
jgi:glycosyltransferase involved in cell wall biosynthesis